MTCSCDFCRDYRASLRALPAETRMQRIARRAATVLEGAARWLREVAS